MVLREGNFDAAMEFASGSRGYDVPLWVSLAFTRRIMKYTPIGKAHKSAFKPMTMPMIALK
jgi:hypothetical protein